MKELRVNLVLLFLKESSLYQGTSSLYHGNLLIKKVFVGAGSEKEKKNKLFFFEIYLEKGQEVEFIQIRRDWWCVSLCRHHCMAGSTTK